MRYQRRTAAFKNLYDTFFSFLQNGLTNRFTRVFHYKKWRVFQNIDIQNAKILVVVISR